MFTLTTVGYATVCAVLALPFTPLLFASTRGRWLGALADVSAEAPHE